MFSVSYVCERLLLRYNEYNITESVLLFALFALIDKLRLMSDVIRGV